MLVSGKSREGILKTIWPLLIPRYTEYPENSGERVVSKVIIGDSRIKREIRRQYCIGQVPGEKTPYSWLQCSHRSARRTRLCRTTAAWQPTAWRELPHRVHAPDSIACVLGAVLVFIHCVHANVDARRNVTSKFISQPGCCRTLHSCAAQAERSNRHAAILPGLFHGQVGTY
jgi:hypothetical protein